jgi:hypothetical protein
VDHLKQAEKLLEKAETADNDTAYRYIELAQVHLSIWREQRGRGSVYTFNAESQSM